MKPNGQKKAINGKPINQSIATTIFNDLITKRKKIVNELHQSVDNNKLYFEYVGPPKYVHFYKYMASKEPFNELRDNRIRYDKALKNNKSC